ncbi:polygalacturonase-like [Andrographis paniculata]|uniref:polygalacturonase-like n=1 Tax=Andrographis paniculata TaxID=175694 RepID=UPI0021E9AA46|nr:polygalacturonase-like [Andrographis paniculata]
MKTFYKIFAFTVLALEYYLPLSGLAANPTYNVKSFGAKSDGNSDSSNSFLQAWDVACASTAPATVYVPRGRYFLRGINFSGKSCKNHAINIRIDGTLLAPANYNVVGKLGTWLRFDGVTGVSISGGTLDGKGNALWACKNLGRTCPNGATSLAFYNSKDIVINGLISMNSQMFHIVIYGSQNAKLANVKILAPRSSPNTDGIHVEHSSGVTITNAHIGTGDDCISIGPGTSNLWIEKIACGPGHGVSIGSLGWTQNEAGVKNVTVKAVTFTGTTNGLRIKTWARPSNGFVKDIVYQHVTMANVENPIIIDQNYCPNHQNCPNEASGVQVHGVHYEDIHGTSATQVAVKFDCSKAKPCSGIMMEEVNLSYDNKQRAASTASASCANAGGTSAGVVKPTSCF